MHELTDLLIRNTNIEIGSLYSDADKIITDWLKNKATLIGSNYAPLETHQKVEEILGLKEKTLEEKFIEAEFSHYKNPELRKRTLLQELAQIAKEHYNK